jgi:hypothetical protein
MTRVAILGTAPSWRECPFDDPSLRIVSLNDAYALGFPRCDEWYELHPFHEMHFYPKDQPVKEAALPKGKYLRPMGHMEWLAKSAATIPVWLQDAPPSEWPANAQRLPIEALEAKYGTYWASGPAYMLMHLYERGFREFHIYGIHLSTDGERIEQRHNFEHLIGRLLGPQVTMSVVDNVRVYSGAGCRVVLPLSSPILQHERRYAYEPKPVAPYRDELKATLKAIDKLVIALVHWPVGQDKTDALERLARLEIVELDCRQQLAKAAMGGTLVIPALAA